MHPNAQLIEKFYSSFQKKDAAGMLACYHPDVEFADAVFALKGKQAGAMWHMFCEGGRDLALTFGDIQADDARGQAHWEATYTFSATGRKVRNIIEAEFQFKDGKIIRHHDHFDFWRWARMALGPVGVILGWTPLVQNRVKRIGRGNLEKFIQAHPHYQ